MQYSPKGFGQKWPIIVNDLEWTIKKSKRLWGKKWPIMEMVQIKPLIKNSLMAFFVNFENFSKGKLVYYLRLSKKLVLITNEYR